MIVLNTDILDVRQITIATFVLMLTVALMRKSSQRQKQFKIFLLVHLQIFVLMTKIFTEIACIAMLKLFLRTTPICRQIISMKKSPSTSDCIQKYALEKSDTSAVSAKWDLRVKVISTGIQRSTLE